MENNKSISKKVLFSGSLVASAILGLAALQTTAANPVSYTTMGSGAAVRSALTGAATTANAVELACGTKKDSSAAKTKEGKCGEGKCGEGKCGGSKKGKKSTKPAKAKSDSTKAGK